MQRLVVLGTGTGVGKTHVTRLLLRALAEAGERPFALKPIETGFAPRSDGGPRPGSDAFLLEGASLDCARAPAPPPFRPHPLFALGTPVSPHLAARRERRAVSLAGIRRWTRMAAHHATLHGVSIVTFETAGGALSPVAPRLTNADVARALGAARWLLVAPDSLGVLHDVRATLLALTALARAPDYLVLTQARPRDASTGTNAAELPRVGLPRALAVVPRNAGPGVLAPLVRALCAG